MRQLFLFVEQQKGGSQCGDEASADVMTLLFYLIKKVISPITGPRCPDGSRKLRFTDYATLAQDGGKVVSLNAPAAFTPRKYSWYSFLLEAE